MKPITERISEASARFRRLIALEPARTKVIPAAEPPKPTEEEILHGLLTDWARRAPADLDAHFLKAQEGAHELAERSRKEHPETNYWLGYERAMRDVRQAFTQWSHPYAGTPTQSGLQGGSNG